MIFSQQSRAARDLDRKVCFERKFRDRSVISSCLALLACLCFTGESTGREKTTPTAKSTQDPEVTVATASAEYEALAKEACQLINDSRSALKITCAIRMGSATRDSDVFTLIKQAQGCNARFTSPTILTCESKWNHTVADESRSELKDSTEFKDFIKAAFDSFYYHSQVDIKSITKNEICVFNFADIPSATPTIDLGNGGKLAATNHDNNKIWIVMTSDHGFQSSIMEEKTVPMLSVAKGALIAMFDNESKAQRLATVLKQLSALAKAN